MTHAGFYNSFFYRSLFHIIFFIVLCISTTSVASPNQASQEKTLLIGTNKDFAPFEFINSKGVPDGFTIDLMSAVAKQQGLSIKFMPDTWSNVRRDLKDRKIDAVTGMMYSKARDTIYDFSVPNVIIPYILIKRKGTQIQSLDDVKEQEIIVVENVYAHDWLLENKITNSIITVKSPTEALRLLASGKHDCVIIPRLHGLDLIDDLKINNIESTGPPILAHKLSFAVIEDNYELLAKLNEGIFALHQTGEYDEIYLKWFSVTKQSKQIRKITKYVLLFFALIILLLLMVLFWNWLLKRAVHRKTEELCQNEARMKQIVEGIPIPTYVVDENRKVTHWNRACELLTGKTADQIVGTKNYYKAFYANKTYSIVDLLLDNVLTKRVQQHDSTTYRESSVLKGAYETELYFSDLGVDGKWLYGTAVLLRDETGDINGAIETWQDLTESKQLERQFIQSQKMEAIGTLASGIAHDFNNILTVVSVHAQMALLNSSKESSVVENLEHILSAGKHAKNLVNQILTFSRQAEIEIEPIQLTETVEETLKLFRSSLPPNIKMQQVIQSDALVMADATHIHQIVMNLCTNAKHAMADTGGVLEVGLSDVQIDKDQISPQVNLISGKFIKLTISDTGHGIPLEVQNKILDPFFTTKQRGEGTGMGLSVTHGIVTQYGGTIDFKSELGKGTVFHIYLPIV
ncbi:MAG: transporter substrate-binding domain-containing protein [Desulfocapsa sp.]|nr:transporter substrate-binding domain-containing protein [Desulfocapsa sp.]